MVNVDQIIIYSNSIYNKDENILWIADGPRG